MLRAFALYVLDFRGILQRFGASWERLGSVLGRLGSSWGVLGRLGGFLGRLEGVLESSWAVLDRLQLVTESAAFQRRLLTASEQRQESIF